MAVSALANAKAQYNEDFELPVLSPDTAWFGQDQTTDGDTIYSNGFFNFELNYNSAWQSFSGFAVSNMTDVVTPGPSNQFSAITGSGATGSDQYGICYASEWSNNRVFIDDSYSWKSFSDVLITNTTYAYDAMLNGDGISKKFGTDTSAAGVNDGTNGEDWFLLTIYSLDIDTLRTGDSVNFYLADYRFTDPADDYIVNTWESVDVGALGDGGLYPIYGLDFVLTSSDTAGGFGMNTPAYFAIDNLGGGYENILENQITKIEIYPNPTNGEVLIQTITNAELQLFDMNGRLIKREFAISSKVIWDLSDLDAGIYQLISSHNGELSQSKIIKK